jgi:crotonobetainyl-CoA:carnitine CoA-transferase CaiB-like acyl-CoA transferase
VLNAEQTGYGAAYRIYQCEDLAWLALAIPGQQAWDRLRAITGVPGLPAGPPPLTAAGGTSSAGRAALMAEQLLEAAFLHRDAAAWVAELRAAGVPAELVEEPDRTGFAAGFTADPVLIQRGRVVSYEWGEHGLTRQPCFPPAIGPVARPPAMRGIPGLGDYSVPFT